MEIHCLKRFSMELKLQLMHYVESDQKFCLDLFDVSMPIAIIGKDKP